LNLPEFDAFGRYIVPSVGKVEHAPKSGIRVWFRDLEKREVCRVRGR
jgi:hypothetical protein